MHFFIILLLLPASGLAGSSEHKEVWTQLKSIAMRILGGKITLSDVFYGVGLVASLFMDHKSVLASQAKQLAHAEVSGEKDELASAMFLSLYGDKEDDSSNATDSNSSKPHEIGMGEAFWEFLQMEYFLALYRSKERLVRKKRRAQTIGGLIQDFDVDVSSSFSVTPESETEATEYSPYIADMAFFFPVIDFLFPFTGSFNFFQTEYNLFTLMSTTNQFNLLPVFGATTGIGV